MTKRSIKGERSFLKAPHVVICDVISGNLEWIEIFLNKQNQIAVIFELQNSFPANNQSKKDITLTK